MGGGRSKVTSATGLMSEMARKRAGKLLDEAILPNLDSNPL